jgi:DNA-binding IclR family transcriptional regulator
MRNKSTQPNIGFIKVIPKTLRLIEAMAERKSAYPLSDLARALGQPKTSVFRILATLKQEGYVQQVPGTDAYELTERVALWNRNKAEDTLRHAARPFLGRLLARFEQTVNLAVFDSGQIRYIEILEGLRSIRATPTIDTMAPFHCTALGKSVLAFLPSDEARRKLESNVPLPKYTAHTITSLRVLNQELSQIRKQGFALDNEETEEGAQCVAAPILGPKGEPLAAISISGPVSMLHGNVLQEIAQALRQCARAIASQLGYQA